MRRGAIVVALAVTVACTRRDAAPSSGAAAEASASPSTASLASAEPSASVEALAPSASASAEVAPVDAGPHFVDRKVALAEAAEFGMMGLVAGSDAGLESVSGPGMRYPVGATRFPGRSVVVPSVRLGTITVHGQLPKAVVERVVRQRFGSFRLCYESGLRLNSSLAGRVTTRFEIGVDGLVSGAQESASDLPDQNAVHCVVRAFEKIAFPKPEDGTVVATVPLVFSASSHP